jgi:Pathogenicity locus
MNTKADVLKEFRMIPGIGKACALDLWNIGMRSISDLKDQNPQVLYHKLNLVTGMTHDICMLYAFRCAVYFASVKKQDPEKLKWWYWKGKKFKE